MEKLERKPGVLDIETFVTSFQRGTFETPSVLSSRASAQRIHLYGPSLELEQHIVGPWLSFVNLPLVVFSNLSWSLREVLCQAKRIRFLVQ